MHAMMHGLIQVTYYHKSHALLHFSSWLSYSVNYSRLIAQYVIDDFEIPRIAFLSLHNS